VSIFVLVFTNNKVFKTQVIALVDPCFLLRDEIIGSISSTPSMSRPVSDLWNKAQSVIVGNSNQFQMVVLSVCEYTISDEFVRELCTATLIEEKY
jgi:hypothetical protein